MLAKVASRPPLGTPLFKHQAVRAPVHSLPQLLPPTRTDSKKNDGVSNRVFLQILRESRGVSMDQLLHFFRERYAQNLLTCIGIIVTVASVAPTHRLLTPSHEAGKHTAALARSNQDFVTVMQRQLETMSQVHALAEAAREKTASIQRKDRLDAYWTIYTNTAMLRAGCRRIIGHGTPLPRVGEDVPRNRDAASVTRARLAESYRYTRRAVASGIRSDTDAMLAIVARATDEYSNVRKARYRAAT